MGGRSGTKENSHIKGYIPKGEWKKVVDPITGSVQYIRKKISTDRRK